MVISKEQIVAWLKELAVVMQENREYLTELDSAIGDADHGINMNRGFDKVAEALPKFAESDIGTILKSTGMTLMSSVGGASGPLYGTFFMRSGMALVAKEELDSNDLLTLFKSGCEGIVQRGKPNVGDKTMYDVWIPTIEAYEKAVDGDLLAALKQAVAAAEAGKEATIPMQAKKGRASYLGERSIGHQDPGATSSCLILQTLLKIVEA